VIVTNSTNINKRTITSHFTELTERCKEIHPFYHRYDRELGYNLIIQLENDDIVGSF